MSEGWQVIAGFGGNHVIPIADEQEHRATTSCACVPFLNGRITWIHHAYDCRELIEEAEAIFRS